MRETRFLPWFHLPPEESTLIRRLPWTSRTDSTSGSFGSDARRPKPPHSQPPRRRSGEGDRPSADPTRGNHIYSDGRVVVTRTHSPGVLSIDGAIDYQNAEAVAMALATELETRAAEESLGSGPIAHLRLDLSRLEFVDPSGIRALVKVAERTGERQRLVLQGLPASVRCVMTIVGWADLPRLVIDDRRIDSE